MDSSLTWTARCQCASSSVSAKPTHPKVRETEHSSGSNRNRRFQCVRPDRTSIFDRMKDEGLSLLLSMVSVLFHTSHSADSVATQHPQSNIDSDLPEASAHGYMVLHRISPSMPIPILTLVLSLRHFYNFVV